ncbi:MAG: type II secretion system protein [Minisyncoccia bacterium]
MRKHTSAGFTLIELMVVISIIGVLSSIVMSTFTQARAKARDASRQASMHTIVTALQEYYLEYGCLPITQGTTICGPATGTYSDANAGDWDYSSQGGFLGFLVTAGVLKKVPVDPTNNMTGDAVPSGTYAFRYYCYPSAWDRGVHLGYWSETTGEDVSVIPQIAGDWQTPSWSDPSFVCK